MNMHQLDEGSIARLYQHTIDRNIGIVTAFRGRYTKTENLARNAKLQSDIRGAGFGFYRLEGHYIEGFGSEASKDVKEQSFLVIGDLKEDSGRLKGMLKKWGAKWNQDSVLYKSNTGKNAVLMGTQSKDEEGKEATSCEKENCNFGRFDLHDEGNYTHDGHKLRFFSRWKAQFVTVGII